MTPIRVRHVADSGGGTTLSEPPQARREEFGQQNSWSSFMSTEHSSEQITSGVPLPTRRQPAPLCPKCASENVGDGISVDAEGGVTLSKAIPKNPDAWVSLMTTVRRQVLARVCGDCGHVELYVEGPGELVELAIRARSLEEEKRAARP
jgi:hypothetical protein